jgi:hypothetical protein
MGEGTPSSLLMLLFLTTQDRTAIDPATQLGLVSLTVSGPERSPRST